MPKKIRKSETRKVICGHCGNVSHVSIPCDLSYPEPEQIKGIHLWPPRFHQMVTCPYCKATYAYEGGRWIAYIPVELEIVE